MSRPSPAFITLLLDNMRANTSTEALGFRLEFKATAKFGSKPFKTVTTVKTIETGHLSTTLHVDDRYVVKLQRKLEAGVDPEIEIGSFLTGVAGFANTPALLGTVKLVHDGHRTAVASVHEFVQNQGDAWAVTSAYLDRFVDDQRLLAATEAAHESDEQVSYQRYMAQAGKRIAEMQTALASRDDIEDFRPEPATRREHTAARRRGAPAHGPALRDAVARARPDAGCGARAGGSRARGKAEAARMFRGAAADIARLGRTSAITATFISDRC